MLVEGKNFLIDSSSLGSACMGDFNPFITFSRQKILLCGCLCFVKTKLPLHVLLSTRNMKMKLG